MFQVPKFVSRYDTDIMHKLVDLRDFSMYWDTDAAMVGDLPVSELAVSNIHRNNADLS